MQIKPQARPGLPGNSLFIDARDELNQVFDGSDGVNGFSFSVILRHMDKTQRAAGYDPLKGEALVGNSLSPNNTIWATTDIITKVIKKKILGRFVDDQAGLVKENIGIFYFKYDSIVWEQDIIIEIPVDDHGNPKSPVKYLKKFQVQDVERVHGNDGRVEYLNVYSERMD